MDLAQHARLVADVQQRLLAEHASKRPSANGRATGIAADDADLRVEPDQAREPGGAGGAPGVELHRDHRQPRRLATKRAGPPSPAHRSSTRVRAWMPARRASASTAARPP